MAQMESALDCTYASTTRALPSRVALAHRALTTALTVRTHRAHPHFPCQPHFTRPPLLPTALAVPTALTRAHRSFCAQRT
eukprot:110668-Prymnesium_polylepis.1